MNQRGEDDAIDGEGREMTTADAGTVALLNRSEIDQQISTARRFPRSMKKFLDDATELATLDEATAAECIYALPRDGKTIEGPSVRFAEILQSAWGNSRAGARIVDEGPEFIVAQGVFHDLEKNTAVTYEVRRRITNKKGQRFRADMIAVTANAACSIALRNSILKGIPKAVWRGVYEKTRKVIMGDFQTLANRRQLAIEAFGKFGVLPEQIFKVLEKKSADEITLDDLVVLRGLLNAIKEGDTTPEQAFSGSTTEAPRTSGVAERLSGNQGQGFSQADVEREIDSSKSKSEAQPGGAAVTRSQPGPSGEAIPQASTGAAATGPEGSEEPPQANAEPGASVEEVQKTPGAESSGKRVADKAGERGDGNKPVEPSDAVAPTLENLEAFSKALFRANQPKSLATYRDQFFKGKMPPAEDTPEHKKFADVMALHEGRFKGGSDPKEIPAKIKEIAAR